MSASELAPAIMLGSLVTLALTLAQLLPTGEATVLVRARGGAADAAMMADAALVAVPAAGYAVLHGDAARIRRALGLAVQWNGGPPCAASP